MSIVGACDICKFKTAFQCLLKWEKIGGAYWIVQLELLRHYFIYILIHSEDSLKDIFPIHIVEYTNSEKLQNAIQELYHDLYMLMKSTNEENQEVSES